MKEGEGVLRQYDLWEFWNNLPPEIKYKILNYFEETPLMFDYKDLFQGKIRMLPHTTPIRILNLLLVSTDLEMCDLFFEKFKDYNNLIKNEWYWVDLHFFLLNYSKRVYSLFLEKECNENRFLNSYKIEHHNIIFIKKNLLNKNMFPVRNPLLEQFLIYLEKQKDYKKVIELASYYNEQGWTNNFNKRLLRCSKKIKL